MSEVLKEKEGLILVIEERQKGVISPDGKVKSVETEGTIYVYNKTGSPLYDVEIALTNIDYTDLPKKLTAGIIPIFSEEKGPTKFDYKVVEKAPGTLITETLELPADIAKPVALFKEKIDIKIAYKVKNELKAETTVDLEREVPAQFQVGELPRLESGEIKLEDSKLTVSNMKVPGEAELKIEIPVTIYTESTDAFRSGKSKYTYYGEGGSEASLSGVEVVEIIATPNVPYYVDKNERLEQRGVWDNYIIVENPTKAPIKVVAQVAFVTGKLLTPEEGGAEFKGTLEPKFPGRREYDVLTFEPVVINPGETAKIGPFTVRSEGEPKLDASLKIYVLPEIIYVVKGEFEIEDVEIPVVWGKATKEVHVTHPPAYATADKYNLVAHLVEDVNVETVVENLGSAGLDRVLIVETLPEDHKPPRPIDVKVYLWKAGGELELPPEVAKVSIEPADTDPSKPHNILIEVYGLAYTLGEPMMKGDKIIVRYTVKSADPKPDKVYEYPTRVELSMTADTRPRVIELEEVPKIKTIMAVKKITKLRKVDPAEEPDTFIVTLTLKNEGDLPESNYEVVEIIPPTFELIPERASPQPAETEETETGGLRVRWVIAEIPAKSETTVTYVVKGKPGYKVSELLRIAQ